MSSSYSIVFWLSLYVINAPQLLKTNLKHSLKSLGRLNAEYKAVNKITWLTVKLESTLTFRS